jgi:dTDP-4-amino-4,6-dideoxygalactose transaminase
MKRIEFGELQIGEVARAHLMDVCDTNWATDGPKTREFERQWGELFRYKYNVAVSSGTDACINACLALSAKRGSEVIVPALSFIATSNAVRAAGLVPVFVDVKKETLNIDETLIEEKITDKTVAIMPVHTMGRICDMPAIRYIADGDNLVVIEDACEAHGARLNGDFVGHWSDMVVFSYYVAHLICCGEGGMISTPHPWYADVLNSTKSHGRPFDSLYFDHERTGINSKMNDMEASLGLEGVGKFWKTFNTRRVTRNYIRFQCEGFEDKAWFSEEDGGRINCPHGFSITMKEEGTIDKLVKSLDKYNINHKRNFGSIPTQHLAFKDMGHKLGEFPNAEWIGDNGIHIGTHQYLSLKDIGRICKAVVEGLE